MMCINVYDYYNMYTSMYQKIIIVVVKEPSAPPDLILESIGFSAMPRQYFRVWAVFPGFKVEFSGAKSMTVEMV